MAKKRRDCKECLHESKCKGCPGFKPKRDPVEEWNEAIAGKPVAEWPPMPKEITFVRYDNGIILTTADNLLEYLEESGWRCDNAK